MAGKLDYWAVVERQFLNEELQFFQAGGKLLSPSGDDITRTKVVQIEKRLEHANAVIQANSDGADAA